MSSTDFRSEEYDEKSKFVPVSACTHIDATRTTHFLDSPTMEFSILQSMQFTKLINSRTD